ncbi:MAG: class I SAM-dependent methyltransferase [Nitrososphaerota archaeon]|nr:class I SAM-dependent methyltransferase [Nitrososphaerota archaeon]
MRNSYSSSKISQPKEIEQTFDLYAEDFDRWFSENKKIYLSELYALQACRPYGRILDVGVGTGVFASKLGVEVGIDVSAVMLEKSRKRGIDVVQADVKALPLRSRSFNTVISTFTICFVNHVQGMLEEACRVLKHGGMFVLGEITLDSAWGKVYSKRGRAGHRFYSKASFFTYSQTVKMLSSSTFSITSVYGTLDFGPEDEPSVETPTELKPDDYDSVSRFGFIAIASTSPFMN